VTEDTYESFMTILYSAG